jgi:hypothetical protein
MGNFHGWCILRAPGLKAPFLGISNARLDEAAEKLLVSEALYQGTSLLVPLSC